MSSKLRKNILILLVGSGIAQLIPLLAEPILTRLYTKEEFGVLALYVSVASLFSIIVTARYEMAIMLPKTDRKAINIFGISLFNTLIITALSLVVVLLLSNWIASIFDSKQLRFFLYFVPISVLITGIYQSLNYWSNRQLRYKSISASRIMQSGTNSALSIVSGFLKQGVFGLVFSYIAGQLLSVFPLLHAFRKKDTRSLKLINKKEAKSLAKEYVDFPKLNSFHAFMDVLQINGINFLIAYFFSQGDLGLFSRTYRILLVPISFIGSAFAQVFYQQASKAHANGNSLKTIITKTIRPVFFISAFICAVLLLFGPDIFAFVLGEEWGRAGVFAQYLAPWVFVRFIISPISQLPLILGKQKENFIFAIVGNLLMFSSVAYGAIVANNILHSFLILSIVMIVYYSVLFAWYMKISKR